MIFNIWLKVRSLFIAFVAEYDPFMSANSAGIETEMPCNTKGVRNNDCLYPVENIHSCQNVTLSGRVE